MTIAQTQTDDQIDLAREARLRGRARRLGCRLEKCRTRNLLDPRWGTFGLVHVESGFQASSREWARGYGLTLDEVEQWIEEREALQAEGLA